MNNIKTVILIILYIYTFSYSTGLTNDLNLPIALNGEKTKTNSHSILFKNGVCLYNSKALPKLKNDSLPMFNPYNPIIYELENQLQLIKREKRLQKEILIFCDATTRYNDIHVILNTCGSSGFKKINLAVKKIPSDSIFSLRVKLPKKRKVKDLKNNEEYTSIVMRDSLITLGIYSPVTKTIHPKSKTIINIKSTNHEKLQELLTTTIKLNKSKNIVIGSYVDIKYQDFITILDNCKQAGYDEIVVALAYEIPNNKK